MSTLHSSFSIKLYPTIRASVIQGSSVCGGALGCSHLVALTSRAVVDTREQVNCADNSFWFLLCVPGNSQERREPVHGLLKE